MREERNLFREWAEKSESYAERQTEDLVRVVKYAEELRQNVGRVIDRNSGKTGFVLTVTALAFTNAVLSAARPTWITDFKNFLENLGK